MRMPHGRRAAIVVAASLSALLVAGGALAYWSTSGHGNATVTAATTAAVTLSPGSPTAGLYPGGQSNVVLTVSNPNSARVRIGTLALDTTHGTAGFAVDGAHSACGLDALSFTAQTNGSSGWDVPGKVGATNGSLAITLPNALSISASASNACQGATFTVYLTAT